MVQSACYYQEHTANGGTGHYRRRDVVFTATQYNSVGDVVATGQNTDFFDERWDGDSCEFTFGSTSGAPSPPSLIGTTQISTTVLGGVPPADHTRTQTFSFYKFYDTPSEYLLWEEVRVTSYTESYVDFPTEIKAEMQVAFDALVFPDDASTGFSAIASLDYNATFERVTLQKFRHRWDITTHEGAWFKVTWDVAFYPEGGGAAQPFLLDQTWEWTGPSGGPPAGSEDSWKSPWFITDAPPEEGEYRIVNIRYSGYRSTKFGTPVKVTGNAEDYT